MPSIYDHWSDDAGSTWSNAVLITSGTRPASAQTLDGTVFCCYEDSGTVYLRESEDFGETWSAAFGGATGSRPYMAVDPKRRVLGIAFQDSGYVKFRSSMDAGSTWTTTTVCSEATTVYPEAEYLADGTPYVTYLKSGSWYTYKAPHIDGTGTWSAVT